MTSMPKDPFAFDFGVNFESVADRVKGEREQRLKLAERQLPFHHPYLDDVLRSIMPHDLILLGAETGAGKTELARIIAAANAATGRQVFYFALEAEPNEIERRTKFAILCDLVVDAGRDIRPLNYSDWYRGRCEDITRGLDADAERILADKYRGLHTYYRGSKFDHEDIRKLFLAVQTRAELIVLDHLHYVDIDDENENRGLKRTIQMIRDVAVGMGRPVILIAHLRKRDMRSRSIVPELEMFHGSSDIIKVVTHAVMLAPARCVPSPRGLANTFMYVPKDRIGGSTGLIALCQFNRRLKTYADHYTLGRQRGDGFDPINIDESPRWATKHRPMMVTQAVQP